MIIAEGIDGTGKSTFIDMLAEYGYSRYHFPYDVKNQDLMIKYLSVLNNANSRTALDRSFISEMVYGPVMRGTSKLSLEQLRFLLTEYSKKGFEIVYLTAPKEDLMKRCQDDPEDLKMILDNYDKLHEQYELVMSICSEYIPVHRYDTGVLNVNEMSEGVRKVVKL